MNSANLADAARVTVTWSGARRRSTRGCSGDLANGVDKARAAGIDVYLDAYPPTARRRRATAADQDAFAAWLAGVVQGLPGLKHVIVGNEPNLNLFWLAAVRSRRARTPPRSATSACSPADVRRGQGGGAAGRDRRRRARPLRAPNKRGTGRDTHSPGAVHPRHGHGVPGLAPDEADHGRVRLPPVHGARRPAADLPAQSAREDADDRRLREARLVAPARVRRDGAEGADPAARLRRVRRRGAGSRRRTLDCTAGASRRRRIRCSEATQARYYADGFHLAACQPTVRTIMVFRLIDSPLLPELPVGRLLRRPEDAEVEPRRGRRRRPALPGRARWRAAPPCSRPGRSSTGSAACSPATPTAPTRRSFRRVGSSRPLSTVRGKGVASVPMRLADREAEARPVPHRPPRDRDRVQGERLHDGQPGLRLELALDDDRAETLRVAELRIHPPHRDDSSCRWP